MKKLITLICLLICTNQLFAVINSAKAKPKKMISLSEFVETSNKELEEKLSIDLSWKEKLSYWILKKKMKKMIKKNPDLAKAEIQLDQSNFQEVKKKAEGTGIISLISSVVAVLSIFLLSPTILLILSLVGFITGIVSIVKISNNPGKYNNLWSGIIGVILSGILLLGFLILFASFGAA